MRQTLTRDDIVREIADHRSDLRRFGVRSIALFGSFAKDAATETSDLDFVVDFSPSTYDNFTGLGEFLEQLFGRRVDILTPVGLENIRVTRVAEEIKRTLLHV